MDKALLQKLMARKQQRLADIEEQENREKADLAALERVMELISETDDADEGADAEDDSESPNQVTVTPNSKNGVEAPPREVLYAAGKRKKREGPPREGTIAALAIEYIVTMGGGPQPLEHICEYLEEKRGARMDRLSVDRVLRRETKEGTLVLYGTKQFAAPEWVKLYGGQKEKESLQLN